MTSRRCSNTFCPHQSLYSHMRVGFHVSLAGSEAEALTLMSSIDSKLFLFKFVCWDFNILIYLSYIHEGKRLFIKQD